MWEGTVDVEYNDGVPYNPSTMRVIICPRCGIPQSPDEDIRCWACGFDLYNVCIGYEKRDAAGNIIDYLDTHLNPTNARFCEICGKPTTYSRYGILPDWKDYDRINDIRESEKEDSPITWVSNSIPTGDEDLPF